MHAARDDPSQAVAHGVCLACYAKHRTMEALKKAVLEKFRTSMISNLRELPPFSAPGHA
jgi:hypothetical protein